MTSEDTERQTPEPQDSPTDWVQLAWSALSSNALLSAIAVAFAIVLCAGSAIPQGATYEELLRIYPYAVARAMQSLGLHDLWSSWFLWLFALLFSLNALGAFLRAGARIEEGRWDVEQTPTGNTEELVKRISSTLGDRAPRSRGGVLVWTTGVRREAIGLILLGLVSVAASTVVGRNLGANARLELQTGVQDDTAVLRSLRWDSGGWVQARPPVSVRCDRADPQDPLRRRRCAVGGVEEPVSLRAGKVTRAGDIELRPLAERPRIGGGDPELLVRRGDARAKLLRAKHGTTYELDDGTRLTAYSGPDGPIAVVRPEGDGPAALYVPSGEGQGAESALHLAGVPGVSLEVGLARRPERVLTLCGALFVLIGFLLMALVPDLTVALSPRAEGSLVRARSWNRHDLAERWAASLNPSEAPAETDAEVSS
ncbi:MAG: hypothetical protein VYE15_07855 [Myxococcota bacterium]|nr:hypothetical protein [Myxococcota bacterium]